MANDIRLNHAAQTLVSSFGSRYGKHRADILTQAVCSSPYLAGRFNRAAAEGRIEALGELDTERLPDTVAGFLPSKKTVVLRLDYFTDKEKDTYALVGALAHEVRHSLNLPAQEPAREAFGNAVVAKAQDKNIPDYTPELKAQQEMARRDESMAEIDAFNAVISRWQHLHPNKPIDNSDNLKNLIGKYPDLGNYHAITFNRKNFDELVFNDKFAWDEKTGLLITDNDFKKHSNWQQEQNFEQMGKYFYDIPRTGLSDYRNKNGAKWLNEIFVAEAHFRSKGREERPIMLDMQKLGWSEDELEKAGLRPLSETGIRYITPDAGNGVFEGNRPAPNRQTQPENPKHPAASSFSMDFGLAKTTVQEPSAKQDVQQEQKQEQEKESEPKTEPDFGMGK
nr:hypothetical protein [uncultured Kingella sp.]